MVMNEGWVLVDNGCDNKIQTPLGTSDKFPDRAGGESGLAEASSPLSVPSSLPVGEFTRQGLGFVLLTCLPTALRTELRPKPCLFPGPE
jgi:hypothetical protein